MSTLQCKGCGSGYRSIYCENAPAHERTPEVTEAEMDAIAALPDFTTGIDPKDLALAREQAKVTFDRKHLADLARCLGMAEDSHAADVVTVAAYRLKKRTEALSKLYERFRMDHDHDGNDCPDRCHEAGDPDEINELVLRALDLGAPDAETACERGECGHNSPKTCAKVIGRVRR